jgi:putative endonuclease
METTREIGYKGEAVAVAFLSEKGYDILETNWQCGHYEIDIIAQKDNTLVIVEVKTRSRDFLTLPQESVGKKKQRFLIEAANNYIEQKNFEGETRFDILSLTIYGKTYKIDHIEDAFQPLW